ncbi:hypothetical protein [Pantoea agglomerans]|uniref:Uncharacterized protein n=3 Tax=Erwiniaceae TaxID=1903409 RepID=A0ACC5PPZ7_ENTAG|nr:hypothetical protein [Pantoea agglomerans]MBD8127129.1 hypothetical protein [Pantoea agglomerans]TKJ93864.1 hypothetical protein EpCFBP13511_04690 [Erwinia persicina]
MSEQIPAYNPMLRLPTKANDFSNHFKVTYRPDIAIINAVGDGSCVNPVTIIFVNRQSAAPPGRKKWRFGPEDHGLMENTGDGY